MGNRNFNLKNFIIKSKEFLPEYLKSLKKSDYSSQQLLSFRKALITFLKEYIKASNNKFHKNSFNVDFVNNYLSQTLPRQYSSSFKNEINDIQKIISSFLNYLSIENVLEKKACEDITRDFAKKQEEEEINYSEDPSFFSDDELEDIDQLANKWAVLFLKEESTREKLKNYLPFAHEIIVTITEFMYTYFSETYEMWDPEALEFVCLEISPTKLLADDNFFGAIYPVLTLFISFLNEEGILEKEHADKLKMKLYAISDLIIKNSQDSKYNDFMKLAYLDALESGVDVNDPDQLEPFIFSQMLKHNFESKESFHYLRQEEVRKQNTEEIIQELQEIGIDFDKEIFLNKVHKFYSAEDLTDDWIEKYDPIGSARDEDFIYIAFRILWERLAPKVINSEQIDDMIMKGYDLVRGNKKQREEGLNIWLEVWNHLKDRFKPKMRSIEEAEAVFLGSQSLFNWTQDLTMELFMAGRQDIKFYEKCIEICKKLLTLFPRSHKYFIQNIMRNLAESYFALGKIKKGEKAFEKLTAKYPKHVWGYISWGDQFAHWDKKETYDFDKALSKYKRALNEYDTEKDVILERIEYLKKEKEGVNNRNGFLSDYEIFLQEKNLSMTNIERILHNIEIFLDYIIFNKEMYVMEYIEEKLDFEHFLEFLGIWIIQQEFITSESSMNEMCIDMKSFLKYFEEFRILSPKELNQIYEMCDSREFFYNRLNEYQDADISPDRYRYRKAEFNQWRNNNDYWYIWIRSKRKKEKEKTELEEKKVKLSKEKRKLFGDFKDFL